MSPMLLDALAGALGEFEKTLEASREGRRNHVGAKRRSQGRGGRDQRADTRARWARCGSGLGENAELMGAWASARNVLGPFKPKAEPGAGGSQTPKAA